MHAPGSSNTPPAELDQFTHENRPDAAVKLEPADGLFVFECEAESRAPIASSSGVFDVRRAGPAYDPKPKALSRDESRSARRREKRRARALRLAARAATWRERIDRAREAIRAAAVRGSSALGRAVALATHRSTKAAASSRHAMYRARTILRERRRTAPTSTVTALDHQESNGSVVAVLLGMAVVTYGSFFVGSWRAPGATTRTDVTARSTAQLPFAPPVAPRAAPPVATASIAVVRPVLDTGSPLAGTPRAAAARPVSFSPNARTLTAMWQRRDTRSLNQAFTSLRQQTLAFHRCAMRMLDTDRAVARCEGVASAGPQASRAATWTIDFRRTAGRWAIARVTTR